MRRPPTSRVGKPINLEGAKPVAVEPAAPVPAFQAVLVAGEDSQSLVDVGVDDDELPRRGRVTCLFPSRITSM